MCKFFSFVTQPSVSKDVYYFDWEMRKEDFDGADSHSHICAHFKIDEDTCNKWEYNPLLDELTLDMQNDEIDDMKRVERWVHKLDFKTIVAPLIIKRIINPLELPKVEHVSDEQIDNLKKCASVGASVSNSVLASVGVSVGASVGDSVWASVLDSVSNSVWNSVSNSVLASVWNSVWNSVSNSVLASVWDSVGDSVRNSVRNSIWNSVLASVWNSVRTYISGFINIKYSADFTPAIKLWEAGLVPSFDGKTWRLHSGSKADVVFEWTPEKESEQ